MTRFQADMVLLATALIWGMAFVAQKTGMDGVGPYTFVAARFAITTLVFIPVLAWDRRRDRVEGPAIPARSRMGMTLLALVFAAGMILQQVGIKTTSVTNAGFLTGLYVVFTPFAVWVLSTRPPQQTVWIAAAVSMVGVYLLAAPSGLNTFSQGDALVLASAVMFALYFPIIAKLLEQGARPLAIVFWQYLACCIIATVLMVSTETIDTAALLAAVPELLYAAIPAGALGFALQAIAQQHAPPADTAIILSSEALFAALAGALFLGERLETIGWLGCALIVTAILIVELAPRVTAKHSESS